jgi:hypothetical protein
VMLRLWHLSFLLFFFIRLWVRLIILEIRLRFLGFTLHWLNLAFLDTLVLVDCKMLFLIMRLMNASLIDLVKPLFLLILYLSLGKVLLWLFILDDLIIESILELILSLLQLSNFFPFGFNIVLNAIKAPFLSACKLLCMDIILVKLSVYSLRCS